MEYIAVFDVGTSAIKGLLMQKDGCVFEERSAAIHTYKGKHGEKEQNPEEWWTGMKSITRGWFEEKNIPPESVKAVTFSGQMENVILIREGENTERAILYSDMRAEEESSWIQKQRPDLPDITANAVSASTPLAKLLWLNKREKKPAAVVFSAKDYLIYKLTGVITTDSVTGATTGMMDIQTRTWHPGILESFGIDYFTLPALLSPNDLAGNVLPSGNSGFHGNTPVLCGAGDAGASTMGAGAIHDGDSYFYIGTTGWAAAPTKSHSPKTAGVFTLAHVIHNMNISIAPLLNAGNVYEWTKNTFMPESSYETFENTISQSKPGAGGLVFLPYIHGERFPVQDSNAKGIYFGIQAHTSQADFMRASLEGICYSLRHIAETIIEAKEGKIILIGGGAKSKSWCQILADITNKTVSVPENSEYLPAVGIASTAFLYLGWVKDAGQFVDSYISCLPKNIYRPNQKIRSVYEKGYKQYVKLYPSTKEI
ncbi:xylulokinase [Alteribacillus bidgolensis]|uniref:Xylulokinase n=1 Tax=Alteribacillus bidgolensis TaxID=930129 RepID=A0A1G8EZ23_9BACI|nr:FGGY family carbohydrate kinase [Alteribacillus bidgolensis]SDH75146.1 xylulokinase [Alteribacillus bidgolensis]